METIVKITWDKPEEQQWLCADNIKIALSQHCKNTKFEVVEISTPKDFKERLNEERIQLQDKVEKLESFLQTEKAKVYKNKPRKSNKFGTMSLYYNGIYYFPSDIKESDKREDRPFEIQVVYYKGKWYQDTSYITNEFRDFLLNAL